MARELTPDEISQFYSAHPDVQRAVQNEEPLLVYPKSGIAYYWDQQWRTWQAPKAGENAGMTYVLVWRDASKRWHFIDLEKAGWKLAAEINKPAFVSPGTSLWDNLMTNAGTVLTGIGSGLSTLATAVLVFAVVSLIGTVRK